ncbi:MAG: hypothetical protein WBC94_01505, partial [Xanthobacteraceae bacterium]
AATIYSFAAKAGPLFAVLTAALRAAASRKGAFKARRNPISMRNGEAASRMRAASAKVGQ